MKRSELSIAVIAVALCAHAYGSAVLPDEAGMAPGVSQDAVISQRFIGCGQWYRPEGNAARSWHVHALKREDGSLSAKVNVPGVAELQQLTVEGHIDGRDAFGVLVTEKGEQYATFEATLDEDGRGGSFVLGNGESGRWGYDDATGREVRRLMGVAEEPAPTAEAEAG